MAGHARYTALLDACVLYPLAIADALMSLAHTGLFAAKWTQRIEQEWMTSLEADRPDLKGKLDIRRDSMRIAIPDWEVPENAWAPLVEGCHLPDPNDRHVLAAAIAGHADCIVTANLRDFPIEIAHRYAIEVTDPDRFIVNQWDLDPLAAMSAFKGMRARRKKPESTPDEFAQVLERNRLPATALRIRDAAALI